MEKEYTSTQFNTLDDIEAYKTKVRKSIRHDEEEMASLWNSLFHKESHHEAKTPVQRLTSYVNIGSGVLDGVILGWKLYRKFNGKVSFRKRR